MRYPLFPTATLKFSLRRIRSNPANRNVMTASSLPYRELGRSTQRWRPRRCRTENFTLFLDEQTDVVGDIACIDGRLAHEPVEVID